MTDCVFCEIVETEVADGFLSHNMYNAVSFTPLNPVTEGHRLFVPRVHAKNAGQDMRGAAEAFGAATLWAYHHKGQHFNIITSGGEYATQTIFHTHIHYVPRREGDGLMLPWTNQER